MKPTGKESSGQRRATSPRRDAFKETDRPRHYLTEEEVHAWLGAKVDTAISFASDGVTLTKESRELLWFVANQMMSTSDIHVDISFARPTEEDQTKERSIIVRNYFTLLGINERRVITQTVANTETTLSFFRQE